MAKICVLSSREAKALECGLPKNATWGEIGSAMDNNTRRTISSARNLEENIPWDLIGYCRVRKQQLISEHNLDIPNTASWHEICKEIEKKEQSEIVIYFSPIETTQQLAA